MAKQKIDSYQTITPDQIRSGMEVRLHLKIKEKNPKGEIKERIQVFEGMILKRRGGANEGATFTIRKLSGGIGVERIFPILSPNIVKVELVREIHATKSKLYYLRGYKKKLKEKGK